MKRQPKTPLTPEMRWKITRRRLLIGTGTLGVLAVGGWFGLEQGRPMLMDALEGGSGSTEVPLNPNLWFEITPENKIRFYAPKFEMGQGIHSALAQIAAEELEVAWSQLEAIQADHTHGFDPGLMFTFGSTSVSSLFKPIREAAATMREMLRAEAALQLQTEPAEIVAQNGSCYARQKVNQKLTYGQIIKAKQGEWAVPTTAPALKAKNAFTSIGKNMPRLDTRAKLLGQPVYAFDARVPKMLFGAVARAPRFGARLTQASAGTAEQQLGVVKVVIDTSANFAGVVAKTRTQAKNALQNLELTWEGGTNIEQAELEALVTAKPGQGVVVRKRGAANLATIGLSIEASYRTPLAAHAHLEPLAATVHVQDKLIEAWVPTQMSTAEARALDPWSKDREVKIYPMQMGGSFGRKGSQTATGEAARLSNAVGQAVSVAWTREEEMQHSIYRPPSHTHLRGSLTADGKIQGIQQVTASGDIIFSFINMPEFVKNTIGVDFGIIAGLFLPYDIPNYEVRSQRVGLPIPTGAWRGVGLFPNVFALESFIDELAITANQDPLEFRLAHIPPTSEGERMRGVLSDVRERSGWNTPAPEGRARGVAFSTSTGTHVAMVVEVAIRDKEIIIERVTVSVDAGLVINPANAALQAKGSVVMGISSTLIEAITIKAGAVEQSNFRVTGDTSGKAYPLLTLKQTPRAIDVHFMEGGDEPHGMGEPVIGPVGAAIANAVYALTKTRLRELPLSLPS